MTKLNKMAKKSTMMARKYVIVWSELVYGIWIVRCSRLYQGMNVDVKQVAIKSIVFRVASRVEDHAKQFLLCN